MSRIGLHLLKVLCYISESSVSQPRVFTVHSQGGEQKIFNAIKTKIIILSLTFCKCGKGNCKYAANKTSLIYFMNVFYTDRKKNNHLLSLQFWCWFNWPCNHILNILVWMNIGIFLRTFLALALVELWRVLLSFLCDLAERLASFLTNKAMKKPSPCLAGSVRTRFSAAR